MATEIKLLEMMYRQNIRTIKELHERTHISRTVISNLLNGNQKNIRLDTIERLCEALDCEINELINYKREKRKQNGATIEKEVKHLYGKISSNPY